MDVLRQWVARKYNLPWTHSSIQDQTVFELLISFWEDYYINNKKETHRREDGEVMYTTGDPLIDKWEKELAQGLTPDLLEGLPSWHRRKSERALAAKQNVEEKAQDSDSTLDGFTEDYSTMISRSAAPVLGQAYHQERLKRK